MTALGVVVAPMSSTPSKSPGSAVPQASSAAGMEKSIGDIPHTDLVHLCLKMNKKIQTNEVKLSEISKRNRKLIDERTSLFAIMKNIININSSVIDSKASMDDSVELDTATLEVDCASYAKEREDTQKRLAEKEQELAMYIVQADAKYEKLKLQTRGGDATSAVAADMFAPETSWLEEKQCLQSEVVDLKSKVKLSESDVSKLLNESNKQKSEIASLEKMLSDQTSKLALFQKENEKTKGAYEEKLLFLQMQLNGLKGKEEGKEKEGASMKTHLESANARVQQQAVQLEEKTLALRANEQLLHGLQAKVEQLEPQAERAKELERNSHATTMLLAEKDALIKSLRNDCRRILEEKEDGAKRLRDLEEHRVRAEGHLMKLQQSSELAQRLAVQLEEKTSLITRLHTEAQTSERNHAMRTAMLAAVEAQLVSTKASLTASEEQVKTSATQYFDLQDKCNIAESRAAENARAATARVAEIEFAMKSLESSQITKIHILTGERDATIDGIKKDFAKKSSLARQLLSEKEEECRVLQQKVSELQDEINSGAPSERKIFEYAQKQAQREVTHNIHTDTREVAFRQMQHTLASRDLDLARVQQLYSELSHEVIELRRNIKREDVNMDYLKNIIVQFMALPVQSSERSSLVPVIATLLQFNRRELVEVQKTMHNPYSAIAIKEVVRRTSINPNPNPNPPFSATPSTSPVESRGGSIDIKMALNGVTPPIYTAGRVMSSNDSLSSQDEVLSN